MAGVTFGLFLGAGVIIQAAKEDNLSKKDLYLISIFLVACHAVVEDTLIFIPLGINVIPLFLIRLLTAIIITALIARMWKKEEKGVSPACRVTTYRAMVRTHGFTHYLLGGLL